MNTGSHGMIKQKPLEYMTRAELYEYINTLIKHISRAELYRYIRTLIELLKERDDFKDKLSQQVRGAHQ